MTTDAVRSGQVGRAIDAAIDAGAWLGAVAVWGDATGIAGCCARGRRADGTAMHGGVVFDLASLTKPLAGGTALALLADRGDLDLRGVLDPRVELPGCFHGVAPTIGALATHSSGLDNSKPDPALRGPAALAGWRAAARVTAAPGQVFSYSCLGAVLLGEHAAVRLGSGLDRLVNDTLSRPLGIGLSYRADVRGGAVEPGTPAASPGVVADEPAAAIGRPLANAGLFASAEDLGRVCAGLLTLHAGRPTPIPLTPGALRAVWSVVPGAPVPHGVLWDRGSAKALRLQPTASSGDCVGHGGFTGHSLWIDAGRGCFAVLCSNRLHAPGAVGPGWQRHARMAARWLGAVIDQVQPP